MRQEPPQFELGLWPLRISAKGPLAVLLAGVVIGLLVIEAKPLLLAKIAALYP